MCECVCGEKGANIISNDPSGQVSKLPPRVHLQAIESGSNGSKDFFTVSAATAQVLSPSRILTRCGWS